MDLFLSALIVMVVGMGFVFAFLCLQVLATDKFAKIAAKYSYLLPESEKPAPRKPAAKAAGNDGEVAAVIAAALKQSGKLPLK
jgi:sodium pump decarboxylase gamma subunit